MSFTALPNDCLLACLSRVPYADLRNGLPSTCKSIRDAVASKAFRKTREAAGYVEVAVFARNWWNTETASSYLVQASGSYRAAPGPRDDTYPHDDTRLSSCCGDEVVIMDVDPDGGAKAFHPGQNRWREFNFVGNGGAPRPTCGAPGGTVMVGGSGGSGIINSGRTPMYVYNSSQDAWSHGPDLPFDPNEATAKVLMVDGKLWLYALDEHERETFVYDPATQIWTPGPRLPHELYPVYGVLWHCAAFEWRKRFCVMGLFHTLFDSHRYLAFVWDPIREAWDEAPFPVPPVIALHHDSIDGNLIISGNIESSDYTGPMKSARIFVLKPGSRDWAEWILPDELKRHGLPITAVRVG